MVEGAFRRVMHASLVRMRRDGRATDIAAHTTADRVTLAKRDRTLNPAANRDITRVRVTVLNSVIILIS